MHTVSNLSANSCTAAIMPCAWGILVDGLLICPGYIPRNLSANFLHKLYESQNVKFAAGTIKAFVDLHKLKIMHGSAQNEDFLPESSHKTISILGCYLSWRLWAVSCMHRGRVRDIYPLPLCDGDPTLTMFICHCQKVGYYE